MACRLKTGNEKTLQEDILKGYITKDIVKAITKDIVKAIFRETKHFCTKNYAMFEICPNFIIFCYEKLLILFEISSVNFFFSDFEFNLLHWSTFTFEYTRLFLMFALKSSI